MSKLLITGGAGFLGYHLCKKLSDKYDEIIVVEGRADVVNLLKNRVNNVIGMNGTKLPETVIELSKEKEILNFGVLNKLYRLIIIYQYKSK